MLVHLYGSLALRTLRIRAAPFGALLTRTTVRVGAALALLQANPHAAAIETLTIGRQPTESVAADIGERVVAEACRRIGIAVVFKRMPLPRTIEAANDGGPMATFSASPICPAAFRA